MTQPARPDPDQSDTAALPAFLQASGLATDPREARIETLTGGVASDIWRVESGGRVFAVKRALGQLRVARDWHVPTARNASEVAWLLLADAIAPGSAPRVLAHDPADGMFAMEFLDPATHPVWKTELRAGRADPAFAASVGRALGAIHAATAGDPETAARFANQPLFQAIRIEPYLETAALAHPDLAAPLRELSRGLLDARIALMHGDVSPKNILCGPRGPVFLDAECACFGDPAFDAAFCLNHLLLKCLWLPDAAASLLACFDALARAWLDAAAWEDRSGLERRAAALLPALMLARVDGKSPVEYLTDARQQDVVRRFAREAILTPRRDLAVLRDGWRAAAAVLRA